MTTQSGTGLVEVLIGIWEEALGMADIGMEENFFDLGGDSMAATTIATRIQRELGQEVPIRLIFNHPTVAELAAALTVEAVA
ncbi:phosphopantetheine-binding protein [Streptomyces sp. NPDC048718]|uniref:phosphopantetheine-binding protein n=1 Tax=Streptomyces sp. NPDC048718 TaxID=3365587 RepID=UPI00371E36F6